MMGVGQYGAIAGATANSIYSAVGEMSPSAVKQRKLLAADVSRMENGQLGDSSALTANKLGRDQRALMATASQQNQELARNAAATGTAGRSGAYFAAQQAANQNVTNALAGQAAKYEEDSSRRAMAERAQVMQRLDAEADRGRNFWRRKGDIAERGADKFSGSYTGGSETDYAGIEADFGGMG